jgi:hypothetical protein
VRAAAIVEPRNNETNFEQRGATRRYQRCDHAERSPSRLAGHVPARDLVAPRKPQQRACREKQDRRNDVHGAHSCSKAVRSHHNCRKQAIALFDLTMSEIGYFNSYAVGKDVGAFRLTQSSEIPNPAEAVSRLMPIEGYKARWGNARRWGSFKTAPTSKRPMIHVSQRNARSHGSMTRGLVFQRRAMTASIPIMTNGSMAEIANNPSNMSFASGLTIHHFTPR